MLRCRRLRQNSLSHLVNACCNLFCHVIVTGSEQAQQLLGRLQTAEHRVSVSVCHNTGASAVHHIRPILAQCCSAAMHQNGTQHQNRARQNACLTAKQQTAIPDILPRERRLLKVSCHINTKTKLGCTCCGLLRAMSCSQLAADMALLTGVP